MAELYARVCRSAPSANFMKRRASSRGATAAYSVTNDCLRRFWRSTPVRGYLYARARHATL